MLRPTSSQNAPDELLLLFNIGCLIVAGSLFVAAPLALSPLAGRVTDLLGEARNALLKDVAGEIGISGGLGFAGAGARLAWPFKDGCQRDDIKQVGIEAAPAWQRIVNLTWLIAIAGK
jgi:hypothetical protein